MQHSNRVLVLRVGAPHVVVIYLLNNHAENGIFTGLLCVEMAFVNTSIMFNRTAPEERVKKAWLKTPTIRKSCLHYGRGVKLGTAEKELYLVEEKALEPQADHNLFVWQLLVLKPVIVQRGTRHVPIALCTFSNLEHYFTFPALLSTFLTCEQNLRILRFFGNIQALFLHFSNILSSRRFQ